VLVVADRLSGVELERHRAEYLTDGVTVIAGAIPGGLLSDLRREAEKLRAIATEEGVVDSGRRPVHGCRGYEDRGIDNSVFDRFRELPRLQQVAYAVLGPEFSVEERMTMLFEGPRTRVQAFHRDNPHDVMRLGDEVWQSVITDMRLFNQFNAALYDDGAFWVVPGSHCRPDTPVEAQLHEESTKASEDLIQQIPPGGVETLDPEQQRRLFAEMDRRYPVAQTEEMDDGEYEAKALAYVRRIPGGRRVFLGAGDIAFYRQCAWHLGYYLSYHRRATLHGHVRSEAVSKRWNEIEAQAKQLVAS
jgi:hypothetical protein